MKLRFLKFVLFWCVFALSPYGFVQNNSMAQEIKFVVGTEDIPLHKDLIAVEGGVVRFDASMGRIIESVTYSERPNISFAAIKAHYKSILPALGWNYMKNQTSFSFVRGKEKLTIEGWMEKNTILLVRFRIAPAF